jgi:YidC/Oxa1 family membrane protein insertase
MERRLLVAILLSFVVLYAYQALFAPPPVPPPSAENTTVAPESTPAPATTAPAAATSGDSAIAAAPAAEPVLSESVEREIVIETAEVRAVFTNRGARLTHWQLKRHRDDQGAPLDLVVQGMLDSQPLPFSLRVADEMLTRTLNTALYAVTERAGAQGAEVAFEYQDASGLRAAKTFQFQATAYTVQVDANVAVADRAVPVSVEWGPAIGSSGAFTSQYVRRPGGLVFVSEDLTRLTAANIAEQPVHQGDFRYAGVDDHYFLSVVLSPGPATVTFAAVAVPPTAGSEATAREMVAYTVTPAGPGARLTYFAGPKDFDLLASIDRDLVLAVDYGMFAFIVVPLLRSLNWINGYIGNYGWSIIALTVLINGLMFPLRHKSVVSMRKMQEIQPEAKAIQERYAKLKATDPAKQKMNQELMALYRERGVNPASGCVPILLTFPVLLAFYSLLTVSIELRGEPFIGWIRDLSRPDPFYVTPVLMGATQFWQTRLTPQTGVDPAQQKLMQFMPLIFMVFFLWAPSGVVLYWLISNLWGIGQQYLTNRLIGPPNVRRPAAERKVKSGNN